MIVIVILCLSLLQLPSLRVDFLLSLASSSPPPDRSETVPRRGPSTSR